MLERAARRNREGRGPHLVRGDGVRLPFADQAVDVLLSLGVLCCMDDAAVAPAISELWRVLRPGGYCVLGVPKGWSVLSDPLFLARGFRPVVVLRPGRALYQRPADPPAT
jgi:SAM-dependent methyltransferase